MATPIENSAWLEWIASLMGGTPRQTCAATFPPDRFYCLLDELPLHLIPQEQLATLRARADGTHELFLNSSVELLRGDQMPAELHATTDLLHDLALQGTIAWVREPASEFILPFWLGADLENIVVGLNAGLNAEQPVPETISREERFLLAASGIITSPELQKRSVERYQRAVTRAAEMLRERDYAPIGGLIHPFHLAALRRYYRYMIRRGKTFLGDEQSPRRYVAHNENVARFFHAQIAKTVAGVVKAPVKPSYVYLASYLGGAELKKHTDREQCEFSVTLCLDFSPEPARETPWPIRLETPQGETTVYQAIGDGLIYRGTRVPHYRDKLGEGRTSTSIFFHYVPADFTGSLD
jgi:hypothetical protein